jgi:hypothetical protein
VKRSFNFRATIVAYMAAGIAVALAVHFLIAR